MKILVTGSSGLIGSQAVEFYDSQGETVIGADNNQRATFFGSGGDTRWNLERLRSSCRAFQPYDIDIRDRIRLFDLFSTHTFDLILHCAAQPSHDKAREIPIDDFEINAVGTLNLLEATRRSCPEATFIFLSTNKVYGDAPNEWPLVELDTRFDYERVEDRHGIHEQVRIDQSTHSLFGSSKAAADLLVQEYARSFGMITGVFRGGCLTGPAHSGVELHGFLNYLVKVATQGGHYKIYGYRGKQVRDNLHSADVINACESFRKNPRAGEVYNLGGGRENSVSILEAIDRIDRLLGRRVEYEYVDQPRLGDHVCYITDLRKFMRHYPGWKVSRSLDEILIEMGERAMLAR